MKKLKFKVSDEEDVKNMAREMYSSFLFMVYKQIAGLGMVGNLFSVSLNVYTEFIKDNLSLIDG
jgi:hypothetical protein